MRNSLLTIFSLLLFATIAYSQTEITLKNSSFECTPQRGTTTNNPVKDWYDCGRRNFPYESAPDIHPAGLWENTLLATDGDSYLGIVVRDNETWESVSQRLSSPILAGGCYEISLQIAQSDRYVSGSRDEQEQREKNFGNAPSTPLSFHNYTEPTVLRIWGGTRACGVTQLLAESPAVSNSEWKTFQFKLKPNEDFRYLVFEAFYKTPVLTPYNGHILLDNISSIVEIDCKKSIDPIIDFIRDEEEEEEEILAYSKPSPNRKKPFHKKNRKIKKEKPQPRTYKDAEKKEAPKHGTFDDFNKKKMSKGQIINLEKVYFNADTSSIDKDSYIVLEDLYSFLNEYNNLTVEIGGHTNSNPSTARCDKLSTERAKVVADYLIDKGIAKDRITYKGYGKRKPIASNKTRSGRKKNQRVEVKIIEIN